MLADQEGRRPRRLPPAASGRSHGAPCHRHECHLDATGASDGVVFWHGTEVFAQVTNAGEPVRTPSCPPEMWKVAGSIPALAATHGSRTQRPHSTRDAGAFASKRRHGTAAPEHRGVAHSPAPVTQRPARACARRPRAWPRPPSTVGETATPRPDPAAASACRTARASVISSTDGRNAARITGICLGWMAVRPGSPAAAGQARPPAARRRRSGRSTPTSAAAAGPRPGPRPLRGSAPSRARVVSSRSSERRSASPSPMARPGRPGDLEERLDAERRLDQEMQCPAGHAAASARTSAADSTLGTRSADPGGQAAAAAIEIGVAIRRAAVLIRTWAATPAGRGEPGRDFLPGLGLARRRDGVLQVDQHHVGRGVSALANRSGRSPGTYSAVTDAALTAPSPRRPADPPAVNPSSASTASVSAPCPRPVNWMRPRSRTAGTTALHEHRPELGVVDLVDACRAPRNCGSATMSRAS